MYKQNFIQRDTRRLRPNGVLHDTVMILSLSTVPMHINDALSKLDIAPSYALRLVSGIRTPSYLRPSL